MRRDVSFLDQISSAADRHFDAQWVRGFGWCFIICGLFGTIIWVGAAVAALNGFAIADAGTGLPMAASKLFWTVGLSLALSVGCVAGGLVALHLSKQAPTR